MKAKSKARPKKTKVVKTKTVVYQEWSESERGWGVRPDGGSYHLTEEDRVKYIADYWKGMPDSAPDCYSRPEGNPKLVNVDTKLYNLIKKVKLGYRT